MTEQSDKSTPAANVRGKWQIPLFLLGLIACTLAGLFWLFSGSEPTWEDRFGQVVELTESATGGDYTAAEAAAKMLLDSELTPTDQLERRAKLFAQLGEIRWRSIQHTANREPAQLEALRDCYVHAINNTFQPTAEIAERLAEAYDGLGHVDKAVEWYDKAVALDKSRAAKLSRRVIELWRDRLGLSGEELLARLTEFMDAEDLDEEQYGWAVDQAVGGLIASGRSDRAEHLVLGEQSKVRQEPFGWHLRYQLARIHAANGQVMLADDILIQLVPQLPPMSLLSAKANLLRGQLIWRDNPLEAEKVLNSAIVAAPETTVSTAAAVTLARAYGQMALYDKALAQYEPAIVQLAKRPANPYVQVPQLQEALSQSCKSLLAEDKPALAARFVRAERKLFDLGGEAFSVDQRLDMLGRLAGANLAVAEKAQQQYSNATSAPAMAAGGADRLRGLGIDHLTTAAQAFCERASLAKKAGEVKIQADSQWMAAETFEKAALQEQAIQALRIFLADTPEDERAAEARFRLGRAYQTAGRYDEAIAVFNENLATAGQKGRHARAIEGLTYIAMCYIAKGEGFQDEAEKILTSITAGQRPEITPESQVYHSALYTLGWLQHRQGKWHEAVANLREAIQRSPGKLAPATEPDAEKYVRYYLRAARAMYLMANSRHNLGRELAKQAAVEEKPLRRKTLEDAAEDEITQAGLLYKQVIERLEAIGDRLSRQDQAYRRNSYFARGDCLYELRRYEQAMDRYTEAVFRFQRHPAALGGVTQISNCYFAMGQDGKARAAIERARELNKQIDPAEREADGLPTAWDQWLDMFEKLDPATTNNEDAS
ncbi:MAG: tetratricopeptide repeat protein [Planctomycetes bacterium]|nr:tetratricopeptide repeat protein [Planctomycetota bacterium]